MTDQYCSKIKTDDYRIEKTINSFQNAVLSAATKAIPRGARKDYKPYWSRELQELEESLNEARDMAEQEPTVENNIKLKATEAKYRRTHILQARSSWKKKTEELNLDRDGHKLWNLAKAMNNEGTRSAPIAIVNEDTLISGRQAANCFIDNFEDNSNQHVPHDHRVRIHERLKSMAQDEDATDSMNNPFTMKEMDRELNTLNNRKSPGPDQVTNEMLKNLGSKAKQKLLAIYNNSLSSSHVPQVWREAIMIPIHKKGKDKHSTKSYRPISLTSCIGKLMEKMINTRLIWHLENSHFFASEQAGFRQNRSTEDQVTYIAQKIEDGFQNKQQTVAIWIDLEKAFEKVWKDGLRLKLQIAGVKGKMYNWISQYLTNRKARVHLDGSYSRKKTLKHGVPQGGVLSPTLFLVFINDILKEMPRKVFGAMYADDLALWCTEEHVTTASYRLQEALDILNAWTKRWLVKVNPEKTKYTVFSLSTRDQRATLYLEGEIINPDDHPTYLGVTFDKRLTWKTQIDKTEARAKVRLALMKKIAGSTWGADHKTLKTLFVGNVRPIMEYGMCAWGTAAKSNFEKLSKVQNQASRIITGGIKSTPIPAMENLTGLENMQERRDTKLIRQGSKFRRLSEHPMKDRMTELSSKRLQRQSFLDAERSLRIHHPSLANSIPSDIPAVISVPVWKENSIPDINCNVPGIKSKASQTKEERKLYANMHLNEIFPKEIWTRIYTDGSAEDATKNGGAGIFIQHPDGTEDHLSFSTGQLSSIYKAEAKALEHATNFVKDKMESRRNIVFLTDALSVLHALQYSKDRDLNSLMSSLQSINQKHVVQIQWVPSHCDLYGNEKADELAREGSLLDQGNNTTSFQEEKKLITNTMKEKWKEDHPLHNKQDPYYSLTRQEQVVIFRLRTKHSRLRSHLFNKFKIGDSDLCPLCEVESQTTEHILQRCRHLQAMRNSTWPIPIQMTQKLHGSLDDLRRTASFIFESGVTI